MAVATQQIAVRLPEDVLAAVDELVRDGVHESRAAAVRAGVDLVVEAARQSAIDRAIVAGYRTIPPTEAEHDAAVASLRDAILEEPW